MPPGGSAGHTKRPSPVAALQGAMRSELGRRTGWALLGETARFGSAALVFILLARLLGSAAFGRYAGALAFVSVFFPFATLGAGQLLIMAVARQPDTFAAAWRHALTRAALGAAVTIGLVSVLQPVIVPKVGLRVVVLLALAELIGTSLVELAAQAFQAHHQLRLSSIVRATLGAFRLVALGAFVSVGEQRTAEAWVGWYTGSSLLAVLVALVIVTKVLGRPRLAGSRRPRLLGGLSFSFSLSAAYIQDDIDKALVLRYEPSSVAGFYTAGYRFFNIALLPAKAFLTAALPRFFQAGVGGLQGSVTFARSLLRPGLAYGVITAVVCFGVAPSIPALLGPSYAPAADVLRALALLPALRLLQFLAGDALTGAGFQRYRTAAQLSTCILNIVLNVLLIPRYSWRGAVGATLIADGLLLCLLLVVIRMLLRRGDTNDGRAESPEARLGNLAS